MISVRFLEPTPNPNAFKFVTDATLVRGGSLSYASAGEAEGLPLARNLFAVPGVEAVYLMEDFVSVKAAEDANWNRIEEVVRRELGDYAPIDVSLESSGPAHAGGGELMDKVNSVIDEMVRPALAGDGGGLEILGIEGTVVKVRYQGACGGCPSATAGTLYAIENLLKSEVDERISVTAV